MSQAQSVAVVTPTLIRRDNGGWLAVSPPEAPFRIGVVAWSADDARQRFERELGAWVALAADGRDQNT